MTIVLNGTTGITNDGGYTGDGVVFADTTPANTLVTTTGGNVGVGTSSPSVKLDVSGAGIVRGFLTTTDAIKLGGNTSAPTSTDAFIYRPADNTLGFGTGSTERARIDSSGNLLVGTTSNGTNSRLRVASAAQGIDISVANNGANYLTNTSGTASYNAFVFANNGQTYSTCGTIVVSGSSTAYNTGSDYRLKEDIAPMTGALSKVALLKPCTFKWKSTGEADEGFIAHELQEVCPSAVSGEKDAVDAEGNPIYQGIDTSFLVATLTAAIQEQQAIITAQAAQIQQLREKVLEVEEGTSNMLVENTNNLYETITALTARVAALEGTQP